MISLDDLRKLLRRNTIDTLISIKEKERRWKEIKEDTSLPVATLNRSILLLKKFSLISTKNEIYRLKWIGRLFLDILSALNIVKDGKKFSEDEIAKNSALLTLIFIFSALQARGYLDLNKLEECTINEMDMIRNIMESYAQEGLIKIRGNRVEITDKFRNMDLIEILSL